MKKITHYQVALLEADMEKLKTTTGQPTASGALSVAVEFAISNFGGDKE